jgi:hypothetical protein
VSEEANASRRAARRVGVADQSSQSVMFPPIPVSQSTRRPVTATEGIPKPPLGPSSQPRIVRVPNVQWPSRGVSHRTTDPQFVRVRPTA